MPEFIYTMKGLNKTVPPRREILKEIWLSFFHGAKIGVLGLNGAGKSSLLKIMAGVDTEFDGEAFADKKARVGFLPQEPELDPEKSVVTLHAQWHKSSVFVARSVSRNVSCSCCVEVV